MADGNMNPASLPLLTRFKLLMLDFMRNDTVRKLLADSKASAPATKRINAVTVSTSDITIDPSRNLWFRLFNPTTHSQNSLPLILYFHGGGFTKYGPDSKVFDHLCTHLAAGVPALVASVNYRLAPHHKCPSQYDDGFDALKFIDAHHSEILPSNTDLGKCFIGGDSAGGNIAHHVIARALESAEQFRSVRIVGMVGLQPFFGGEERTESELRLTKAPMISVDTTDGYWREFLPEGADRNHPAAHVFESKNLLNFPSALVIVGGNDPLQDWDRRYAEWLNKRGKRVAVVEYPNAFHGFYAFPEMPEFAFFIRDVAGFVQEQLNSN